VQGLKLQIFHTSRALRSSSRAELYERNMARIYGRAVVTWHQLFIDLTCCRSHGGGFHSLCVKPHQRVAPRHLLCFMHRFLKRSRVGTNRKSASVSGAKTGWQSTYWLLHGDACGVGNYVLCVASNHPATAYLHCTNPSRKSLGMGQKLLVTR